MGMRGSITVRIRARLKCLNMGAKKHRLDACLRAECDARLSATS